MRTISILITFFLFSNIADSQDLISKKIEFSVGLNTSVGNFKNDDFTNDKSSFAKNGINVNLSFTNKLSKYSGIAIKSFYNTNKFNSDYFQNKVDAYESAGSSFRRNGTNNSVHYKAFGILIGPTFSYPVDKLSLTSRFLFGYGFLYRPEVFFVSQVGYKARELEAFNSNSTVFNVGVGILYNINENWDLSLNYDYFQGNFDFSDYSTLYIGENLEVEIIKKKYQISSITIGLGLKF